MLSIEKSFAAVGDLFDGCHSPETLPQVAFTEAAAPQLGERPRSWNFVLLIVVDGKSEISLELSAFAL
jgi:hypothetical protein